MEWLWRLTTAVLAVLTMINGGYWEAHHYILRGLGIALVGILALVLVSIVGLPSAEIE
ncbi:hypothetical protein TPY_0307 [Sulfobacillus acidophilus TPY]|uniref:Uncharacterized protein n=1 Tax=Sulfobacillus acidophilus (strain ATCC 700253 / DSM 10332 / NAL) TaxID=679936 RepID=G8TWZ2_SULAD|nr:hypothetical protein TPY_0307 [Sulfobacillus acidophilus TPY]AEW03840.1 hypothetical protein Sulac_0271 [Sulfobacillus acidophilus DSM 10332]MCY0864586.1 hypothetical protein [Sulfobacillus sp.]